MAATKFLDNIGLAYLWSKIKAWANAAFAAISHSHGNITNDGKLGTASRAVITDSNKKIAISSVTSTELGYVSGVTSAIQTQLNGKAASSHNQASNTINLLTGYSKPSTGSALATTDTLNQALGKLEAKVDAYDDSNYVHKTGNEEINGIKIFECGDIRIRNSQVTKGSIPAQDHSWYLFFADSVGGMHSENLSNNGRMGGLIGSLYDTTGNMVVAIHACKNAVGTLDGASVGVVCDRNGVKWGYAPSTSSSRTAGTDIVTRDFVATGGGGNLVHCSGAETISGIKTFNNELERYANISYNGTVTTTKSVYLIVQRGSASEDLGSILFSREPSVLPSPANVVGNRSVLRVRGAGNKLADLNIVIDDNNHAYVTVNKSSGVTFDGYYGKTIQYVPANEVVDSALTYQADSTSKRCGVVRFGNYNGYNLAMIGACDESNSAPRGITVYNTAGTVVAKSNCHFQPESANTFNIGASSNRWANLYISASAVSTSDERCKSLVSNVPDEVLDAWEDISYVQFKFNDAIKEKGTDKARLHNGLIAQDIDKVFKNKGLEASLYGLFCYDEWEGYPEVRSEDGEILEEGLEAGNLYSMRYTEALCMEAAYQRRKNKILENRISELERQVSDMLQILQNLTSSNG